MELWLTENETDNLRLSCRVKKELFVGKSEFQEVGVYDTEEFGRMLVLDGVFQTSIVEEYVYHEMIAHVPLFTHPNPKRVLVIGGGDGGSIREIVKHPEVERADMVEIDGMVVEASKQYLPEISAALIANNPKVHLQIADGIKYMKESKNQFDVIIVDCSDPVGPGVGLFSPEFYQNVYEALKEDGLFVQQTESPFYHQPLIKRIYKDIEKLFPITKLYLAHIPIYPGGMHSFMFGSKCYDPMKVQPNRIKNYQFRYYNAEMHQACFALPNFVQELLK